MAILVTRQPVPASGLRARCLASLQAIKVPASFDFVDGLPRNEGGKVVRTALPALVDRQR